MKFSPLILATFGLLMASRLHAGELIESYTARLSSQDHFSSAGERLTSAAGIIRQDRANFHRFHRPDPEDESDAFFANASNRQLLEQLLDRGATTRGSANLIVNGTPLVSVKVFQEGGRPFVLVEILSR